MPSANHPRYSEVGILHASEITLTRFEVLYADERLSHVPKAAVNMPTHHVFAASGLSAKEYINERVLQEAVWLLQNTTLNQGEISEKLGLDVSYFIKFFRKHTGETPARYRRKEKK